MANPNPKSSPPLDDKSYRNWIASLPCTICRNPLAVSPHHAKTKGSGGGDQHCVPLCHKHHTGDEGVHTLGRETFEKRFSGALGGVSLLDIASYLYGCKDAPASGDILKDADKIFSELDDMELAQKIETINAIRSLLAKHSPFSQEPVDCVQWIPSDSVTANDYNPNTVAPPEMELLEHSIAEDGYTQPIVAWAIDEEFEVIDGFHRHRVGKECKSVSNRVHGYLPLAIIRDDREGRNDRIASTIRHNRARGKHRVEAMSDIVTELKKRNWTDKKIGKELGMDEDEVLRLCQISGLTEVFADADFSMSWDIGIFDDEDSGGMLIEDAE